MNWQQLLRCDTQSKSCKNKQKKKVSWISLGLTKQKTKTNFMLQRTLKSKKEIKQTKKDNLKNWRKYLQTICLINDLYQEYVNIVITLR